jgi:hypothetical protein
MTPEATDLVRQCPRPESNQRTRFRKPLLYPLSYGGDAPLCPTGIPENARLEELDLVAERLAGNIYVDLRSLEVGVAAATSTTTSELEADPARSAKRARVGVPAYRLL